MNEGHAALLAIGLLEERLGGAPLERATEDDRLAIAQRCVFTTHTPSPPATTSSAPTRCTKSSAPNAATPSSASAACTTPCST